MEKLNPGDILVFKAGDNWLSKAIAWLTDSDVSHAAMMLDDKRMVEMSANGIYAGEVNVLEGDDAILLRLAPERDPAPLTEAAQRYIDCKTRYDFPALVYLAGLIICRRIGPTEKYVVITDMILREACVVLDQLIQSVVLKNPDKTMVCSQLVYQVYEDCGKEYHIDIEGGLLQSVRGEEYDYSDGCVCLAELASTAPELEETSGDAAIPDTGAKEGSRIPDIEGLARELYLALTEQDTEDSGSMDFDMAALGSLPSWTKRVLDKMEEFLEKSKSNLPIDALFISPADLAYKSTNLDTIGNMNIVRLI